MAEEDMIFGKNRHFFGGIEPSNMLKFTAGMEGSKVKINAQLPNDTIINGQTLCTVAGAVIRKKITNYPKDEFDGEEIASITSSGIYTDADVDEKGTYYYAAFPYTAQGVYSRNPANRAVVNEPKAMVNFKIRSVYDPDTDTAKVEITASLPSGVVGAIIRKKVTGYPASENDGDEFAVITEDGIYTDNDVVIGDTYYYAAFPYTSTGAYNRSDVNRAEVTPRRRDYLFGYDLVKGTQGQDARVSYPSDVDNADFTPAAMNFSSGIFGYGNWPDTPGEKFMPKPCMLKYDGTVAEYLNPNDYTKTAEGGASQVANIGFDGNAMMEWPKIYTKRWVENGIYHFRCSDMPIDADYDCWSNYDKNNNQIDHFYTPIYFGSSASGKLRSISGQANYVNNTAQTEINLATANGDGWYTEFLADRLLIQDLLVLMAKSTDTQRKYGSGRCASGNSSAIGQGTMNTKGLFWGSTDQTSGVKVFGMENWWGNLWRRIAGWINASGTQKIKITWGTHDGSAVSAFNLDGNGYLPVTGATPVGSSGGYISDTVDLKFGRIPYQASGSATTKEGDGLWFNNGQTDYALVGGNWDDTLLVGAFSANLHYAASLTHTDSGAALSCKPLAA